MKRAVDFDKTLAEFNLNGAEYVPGKTGNPIPKMVNRVRRWLEEGDEIIILTARMWSGKSADILALEKRGIEKFCIDNFGQIFEVTSEKSPHIDFIYDDKAIRVEENTGEIVGCTEDGEFLGDEEVLGDGIGSFFRDKF